MAVTSTLSWYGMKIGATKARKKKKMTPTRPTRPSGRRESSRRKSRTALENPVTRSRKVGRASAATLIRSRLPRDRCADRASHRAGRRRDSRRRPPPSAAGRCRSEEDDTDEADEAERAAREQSQEIQDRVGESGHAVAEGRAGERRDAHPFAPPARPMRGSSFA